MKTPNKKHTKRISKDQWLELALETLASHGVADVKIERLAKALGTSRSGFYWHFKNREDLLVHLLDFWLREYTGVISDNPEVKKLGPKKRLQTVMEMIRDKNLSKYDLAIQAWAKIDPVANRVLQKVVKVRLDFLRSIFVELGFDGDELEMRARLFVCYHSWEDTMFPDLSDKKHSKLKKLRLELFTQH